MVQQPHNPAYQNWQGWSTISANGNTAFTIWLTGLPGVGKTTQAQLVKKALTARGYKVETIDSYVLSAWLQQELHIEEYPRDDYSHTVGYDAFITYICSILAHNGIITITTSVSPYQEARGFAREQLSSFVEVYLHCDTRERQRRVCQQEHVPMMQDQLYQSPTTPELRLDTSTEAAEHTALRIVEYLEQHGYIAPLWEEHEDEEEIGLIKARLKALGYLE